MLIIKLNGMEIKPTCKCLSDLVPLGWIFSSPEAYKNCSDENPRLTLTILYGHVKGVLAIRRIFSLVHMITNTKFSNCLNVFKIGVVWQ